MQIGDTVYVYDPYASLASRWRETKVMGQTSASWILLGAYKVDKKTGKIRGSTHSCMLTIQDKAEHDWEAANRDRIESAVRLCDADMLRKVGALFGIV